MAFVVSDLEGGGTQRVVTSMANAWAAQGRDVTVLTFAGRENDFFPLEPGVRRVVLGNRKPSPWIGAALLANLRRLGKLRGAVRALDAPVVVGFVGHTNILLVLAAKGLGRRVVISERNDPLRQSLGPVWDRLRRLVYPLADVVTANSRSVVQALEAFVPARKLAFLPNPLVSPAGTERPASTDPTVLAVGRLHAQKGHDVLIDAFAVVAPDHTDWRLSIVGEGELRPVLERQINRLGLANASRLEGRVVDVYSCYRAAEIFVLASRHEGTPNALLEAMSCGLPPVVSDGAAGALEYVEHEVTGLVVPAEDRSALVAALSALMDDSALRRRLGDAARARVADLGVERVTQVWDEVLGLAASR